MHRKQHPRRRHGPGKQRGRITNIDPQGGCGFILGEDNIERFFHVTMLVPGVEFNDLRVSQEVKFTHMLSTKGPRAVEVEPVSFNK